MEAVREYIDENYASPIELDDLAAHFGMDKGYLSKSFKKQTGQSIIEYTRVVRINKAKELFRFTDQTLDEIGKAVELLRAVIYQRFSRPWRAWYQVTTENSGNYHHVF